MFHIPPLALAGASSIPSVLRQRKLLHLRERMRTALTAPSINPLVWNSILEFRDNGDVIEITFDVADDDYDDVKFPLQRALISIAYTTSNVFPAIRLILNPDNVVYETVSVA